ncbi:hypothetical protein BIW11_08642 [Tropilaelaps mercedesae]|uniref:Uncharacterized protein n=1 Tax=Tropilaelaps mercedesae TaxID=418985 RepID=A0A1V9XNP9_9ACAR|nr:hypothetical protein BIW11_08642 [Tropilaelaps mercedesae]
MRWTLSLGTVAVAILLAIVACLLTPSDAVGAGGFSKRPRVNFRTWLKNVYPQIAEEDEIIQQIGGATGVGAQDKRNRDEDYGHLRLIVLGNLINVRAEMWICSSAEYMRRGLVALPSETTTAICDSVENNSFTTQPEAKSRQAGFQKKKNDHHAQSQDQDVSSFRKGHQARQRADTRANDECPPIHGPSRDWISGAKLPGRSRVAARSTLASEFLCTCTGNAQVPNVPKARSGLSYFRKSIDDDETAAATVATALANDMPAVAETHGGH